MQRARRRRRGLVAGATVLLMLLPAAGQARPPSPANTPEARDAASEPCVDSYRDVAGQGPSCHTGDGLWKVNLGRQGAVLTHGGDPVPGDGSDANGQHGFDPALVPRNPVCANSNSFLAILARPNDVADPFTVADFQSMIRTIDGQLYASAVESGSPNGAHYRFACT